MAPKSKYRMWHFGLIGFILIAIAASQPAMSLYAWFWESINMFGKMCVGVTFYYYAGREFGYTRTHELSGWPQWIRENVDRVVIGLVIAGALL